ncbi:carboxypeptidase-like regulatory domain-containing protein [Thermodesulfobacteriota bacterium]
MKRFQPSDSFRLTLLLAACCLAVSVAPALSFAQEAAPDEYEPDNTYKEAQVIILNDTALQQHNFHEAGDEDWVIFFGVKDETYLIEVSNYGPDTEAVIEIYDEDGETPISSVSKPTIGSVILPFPCEKDAIYYVRISNYDQSFFGADTTYDLSVSREIAPEISFLTGMITNKDTGLPLKDQNVTVRSITSSASTISVDGVYFMLVSDGSHILNFQAAGYDFFQTNVTVSSGETRTIDVELTPSETDPDPDNSTCSAEALYGQSAVETELLRSYRDQVLRATPHGRALIRLYNRLSPSAARFINDNEALAGTLRKAVDAALPAIRAQLPQ